MKEVLSLFTFGIGALCFVVFVTVIKPDAISAVPATSKQRQKLEQHKARRKRMALARAGRRGRGQSGLDRSTGRETA